MIDFNAMNIKMWSRLGSCGAFGAAMMALSEQDDDLAVITADLCFYSGSDRFRQSHPDQLYNVGIAEQNMIGVAAGMASEGYNVFATTYATFAAARVLDQVRVNMGYMQLPVKLIGLTAGLSVGILGTTHTSNEDLAAIRSIPNIVVLSPADTTETVKAVLAAAKENKPVYIRLSGVMGSPLVYKQDYEYTIGKAIRLREGNDVAIVATGTMVAESLKAAELLAEQGISATVIDMHTIKPLDREMLMSCLDSKLIVTVEEHSTLGGLGSAVSEALAEVAHKPPQLLIGLADHYVHAGDYKYLLEQYGLTPDGIASKIAGKLDAL
ncbi:MAG: transketolase [Clostridia bacterium]|nr:transketolase [Clostridia bacterium]